ncbi:MAG: iron ABC transporter permease [Lutispora sp.]|nr:iron ABC transporter permease [Lutispora sp.]
MEVVKKRKAKQNVINIAFVLLLLFLVMLSLYIGKYPLTIKEISQILLFKSLGKKGVWEPMAENVVLGLRLPRILAAILVGSSLSLSGATYQGIFKNPLISPDFLGVSAGACIGAAIAIIMSLSSTYIQLFAFFGGLLAVMLTLTIPKLIRSDSNIVLVLSGIVVSGAMSSIMGFIKYTADPQKELATITYWQMGSFSYVSMGSIYSVLLPIVLSCLVLFVLSWWIDIVSLGEKEAKSLGVNVSYVRNITVICATLLTASSICIVGTIGWVGLVIPHFARMLAGPENPRLMPTSYLMGAIFMLIVDTINRTLGSAEMPISILTGLIGAPFYGWLLYKQRMRLQ